MTISAKNGKLLTESRAGVLDQTQGKARMKGVLLGLVFDKKGTWGEVWLRVGGRRRTVVGYG